MCEEQTTSTLPHTKPAGAAYIGREAVAVTLGNSCLVPRHPFLQWHHLLEVWHTFSPGSAVFCKFTCRLIRANSHWKEMQNVQIRVRVCKENSITFWTVKAFKISGHKTDCDISQYFWCFTVTSFLQVSSKATRCLYRSICLYKHEKKMLFQLLLLQLFWWEIFIKTYIMLIINISEVLCVGFMLNVLRALYHLLL